MLASKIFSVYLTEQARYNTCYLANCNCGVLASKVKKMRKKHLEESSALFFTCFLLNTALLISTKKGCAFVYGVVVFYSFFFTFCTCVSLLIITCIGTYISLLPTMHSR